MSRPVVLVLSLSAAAIGCASSTGRVEEAQRADKLVGRWEGAIQPRFGNPSNTGRTLQIDSVTLTDGRWIAQGRYGLTGRGLRRTSMDVDSSGSTLAIRFVTGAHSTVRLSLLGDHDLVGSIEYAAAASYFSPGNAEPMRLRRVQ